MPQTSVRIKLSRNEVNKKVLLRERMRHTIAPHSHPDTCLMGGGGERSTSVLAGGGGTPGWGEGVLTGGRGGSGTLSWSGVSPLYPPPPRGQIHTCESITFPILRVRAVNIIT